MKKEEQFWEEKKTEKKTEESALTFRYREKSRILSALHFVQETRKGKKLKVNSVNGHEDKMAKGNGIGMENGNATWVLYQRNTVHLK